MKYVAAFAVAAASLMGSESYALEALSRVSFPAKYKLPVKQAHLADVAEFELKNYSIDVSRESDGQADIAYTLPAKLLGYEHSLTLYMRDKRTETVNGVAQTVREFSSREANAVCRGVWSKMSCEVRFWLKPDLAALEDLLRRERDPRIADRIEIAREFGNDPIGITVIE